MRVCGHLRVTLVALALFVFAFSAVIAKAAQSEWDSYNVLLKTKLPIEKKRGMYVGYRYSHAPVPGDLEYSFVITYGPFERDQPVTADVHFAETASIYEQMSALRQKKPKEDTPSVMSQLKVRSFYLTEQQCPAIRGQFEKFRNLQFPAPRFDFISLDIPNHEFRIVSSTGHMTLEWLDENYPLVRWALETRRALDSCIASSPTAGDPKN